MRPRDTQLAINGCAVTSRLISLDFSSVIVLFALSPLAVAWRSRGSSSAALSHRGAASQPRSNGAAAAQRLGTLVRDELYQGIGLINIIFFT